MSMFSRTANAVMALGELVAPSAATYLPPVAVATIALAQSGCGVGGKPTDPYASERAKLKKGELVGPEMATFEAATRNTGWTASEEGGVRYLRVKHNETNFELTRRVNLVTLKYDGLFEAHTVEVSIPRTLRDDFQHRRDFARKIWNAANAHAEKNANKPKE